MNDKTQTFTNDSRPPGTGAAGSAAETDTMDRIASGAHKGIDAASKAAHPSIDRAAASAHRVVESADQMANHAVEALEDAGDKGEELIRAGTNYMRAHPMLSLGIAVTAGYVLSRLLSSR